MEVVAITPLTVEVMTPLLALSVLELMREEVEITPLTTEVNSFTAEDREFLLMKLAVVEEIVYEPVTVSSTKVLELVRLPAMVLLVPAIMTSPSLALKVPLLV